jgi:hypothetical protein
MGVEPVKPETGTSPSTARKQKSQSMIGGPMSIEELRINKQILKEISKRKKEKLGISIASDI